MMSKQSVLVISILAISGLWSPPSARAADGDECSPACKSDEGLFCGIDGQCHEYGCEKWYEFGPDAYTGRDVTGTTVPALTCADRAINDGIIAHAIVYGCRGLVNSEPATGEGLAFGFNEKCTARINDLVLFECFRLKATTDLSSFEAQVAAADINCAAEDAGTDIGFIYQTVLEWVNFFGSPITARVVFTGLNTTETLDAEVAKKFSMYATLTTSAATAVPATMNPTQAPTQPPTSPSTKSGHSFVLGFLSLVGFFVMYQ